MARVSAPIEVEIPGHWMRRDEALLDRIRKALPEAEVRWEPPSEELAEAFAAAAPHLGASEQEVDAVRRHRSRMTLYAHTGRGSPGGAAEIIQAVRPVFDRPGALGVWVRSTGKAHAVREWVEYQPDQPFDLVRAYVVFGAKDHFRSWGMKSFGLPDVVLHGDHFPQMATALLQSFTVECIESAPRDPPQVYEVAPGAGEVAVRWAMADPGDNPFGHLLLSPVR